ncbi:MAG: P-type conjugative transfer protein TrbJ [Sulfuriferula sp.]
MKKILFFVLLVGTGQAMAGGAMTGGASEWTQVMNNVQLVNQYAQQVQQYSTQLQQYQMQLQNLARNPTTLLGSDISKLLNGVGAIMQAGQSIGGTMAQIDGNFSQKFGNPLTGTFSQNFKTWNSTSTDTLGAALRAAGMHRDEFKTDTAALTALFNKSQQSKGTVAALQTLSELTAMQIQQTQKLGDLLATQNTAASTYMAAQNAKQQQAMDSDFATQSGFIATKPTTVPTINSNSTYKKWNLYK